MNDQQNHQPQSTSSRQLFGRLCIALAVVAAILAVITLFSPTWSERTLAVSPDAGSGETEWALVVGLALASGALAVLGRRLISAAIAR